MHYFIHDYAGHPFQVELSRELARRGHKVTHAYFAGDHGPKGRFERHADDSDRLEFAGIDIAGTYSKQSFVKRRFQDLEYGRCVAAAIRQADPDLVISGNTPTEAQQHVLRASRDCDAAFVYWCQDFYSIAASKILAQKLPGIGSLIGGYYTWLERRQMQAADAVVLITEDFKPTTAQWNIASDRVHVIPNWGAIDEIPQLDKDNNWAREHGLEDKFVILYSGTIGLKHNPALLVALADHFKDDRDVVVVAVATGVGVTHLETARAQGLENLVVLPLQPFERLPEVLASADILCAVIEKDAGVFSVPSKVLSYLCAGRPILLAAPSTNLAARIVTSTKCGQAVASDDMKGWIVAADALRGSVDLRTKTGAAGRDYAEQNFRIGAVADRFEAVFEASMAGTARAEVAR